MTDVPQPRRAGNSPAEWTGFSWNDSSWDLMRGLDVVEDLPLDAWPEAQQPALPRFALGA